MLSDILTLAAGLAILILGGDFLVKGACRVALHVGISPMVTGLTIVAFSTSAPEMLVSLKAALKAVPDFAIGNVVGSNISNLSLVLGAACLFGSIPIHKATTTRDWLVTMLSSLLLYGFVRDGYLERYEGFILFLGLAVYLSFLLIKTKKNQTKSSLPYKTSGNNIFEKFKDFFYLVLGGCCLYLGSEWFIKGAIDLAGYLGISERVVGLTVLALGTSLPELFTSIIAAIKGEKTLALGNLFGSNIFNMLSILGITGMVRSLPVNEAIINTDMVWMLALTLGLLPLMLLRRRLGRDSAIVLLAFYALYIFMVFKY